MRAVDVLTALDPVDRVVLGPDPRPDPRPAARRSTGLLATVGPIDTGSADPPMGEIAFLDDPLVTRAQAGDRAAMESLLERHYDRVYSVCRRMTGNDTDAADAAQEALISITRGIARFDRRSRFGTWVYRIALNAAIDELRRRGRRPTLSLDEGIGADVVAVEPGRGGARGDPEAVSDRADLDAALRRLPPGYRAAVVLRDLCDLEYAEIAETLHLPIGTVRSRIARGRALLASLLAPTPDPT